MKMFKCMASIYPGRTGVVLLLLFSVSNPLIAQSDSLVFPFSEGSRYLLSHEWQGQKAPIESEDDPESFEKKSPSRAFFSSLILPGIGESYVGEAFQSKLFLGLELVGWGLVIANIINVNMRENDYQNYAAMHAMVTPSGKNDQYWINIGKFDTIFDYNEERRRERDIEAIYPETRFFYWQWDLNQNRFNYDAYRIETRETENKRLYLFAAIALNHLVSAINALRLANAHNRRIEEQTINLNFDYNPQRDQFSFSLQKYF